jgi:hypothetical protein
MGLTNHLDAGCEEGEVWERRCAMRLRDGSGRESVSERKGETFFRAALKQVLISALHIKTPTVLLRTQVTTKGENGPNIEGISHR